jgi:hypothetical protein
LQEYLISISISIPGKTATVIDAVYRNIDSSILTQTATVNPLTILFHLRKLCSALLRVSWITLTAIRKAKRNPAFAGSPRPKTINIPSAIQRQ